MAATLYVAFLRAVNVGGRTIKMAELKAIFERLGYDEVSTFIASGNVIFRAAGGVPPLEKRIEAGLQKTLGFAVPAILRTADEVAAVAEFQAFAPKALDRASLYVGFLKERPAAAAADKALALQTDIDELRLNGREIYWLARRNISDSTISMAALEKALQTPTTFRNITTVRRLAAKYA